MGRALRERWAISPKLRETLIEKLGKILESDEAGPREITAAGRAILAASKINLEHISVAIKAHTHEEIGSRLDAVERLVEERSST
jgi:hypothetical protein